MPAAEAGAVAHDRPQPLQLHPLRHGEIGDQGVHLVAGLAPQGAGDPAGEHALSPTAPRPDPKLAAPDEAHRLHPAAPPAHESQPAIQAHVLGRQAAAVPRQDHVVDDIAPGDAQGHAAALGRQPAHLFDEGSARSVALEDGDEVAVQVLSLAAVHDHGHGVPVEGGVVLGRLADRGRRGGEQPVPRKARPVDAHPRLAAGAAEPHPPGPVHGGLLDGADEGVAEVVAPGLPGGGLARRQAHRGARGQQHLAVGRRLQVVHETAAVVGVAGEDVLVAAAAPDAEPVDHVGLVPGADQQQQAPVLVDEPRIGALAGGFDGGEEVAVAGDEEPQVAVARLALRAHVLVASVDGDRVVGQGGGRPAAVAGVGVADVAEPLAAVGEEGHGQHVAVLVAVAAGEVQVRLHLGVAGAAAEAGVAEGRQQHRLRGGHRLAGLPRPGVVEGDDAAVGVAQQAGHLPRPGQDGQPRLEIEVFEAVPAPGRGVTGRIGPALQQAGQDVQPPHRLVVVGDGPLAPDPVGEELPPRQQLDAADGVVDVLRLAEDAAGGDQPPQQGGVHVAEGRRVGAHEGDAGVEQVGLDPPLRRLVEGAARPHQLVRPQQVLGDVHVGPPVPLGGAVVGHRPGEGPVPLEEDLLPEGVVVVDAVARVDLGEARQDQGGAAGGRRSPVAAWRRARSRARRAKYSRASNQPRARKKWR